MTRPVCPIQPAQSKTRPKHLGQAMYRGSRHNIWIPATSYSGYGFPQVIFMIWPATYSARTVCPECHGRVALERVAFTPTFACPNCGSHIHISERYRRVHNWICWSLGFVISFGLGVRWWVSLLMWIPWSMTVFFLWAYVGKYALPPKLEKCAIENPSILLLGPK